MREIDVTLKIKAIISDKYITQFFFLSAYQDYFLDETYSFYRKLNDLLERFYLPYDVVSMSRGRTQFTVKYARPDNLQSGDIPEIDQMLKAYFTPREEWCCGNCIYERKGKCTVDEIKKDIVLTECCSSWTEKDL